MMLTRRMEDRLLAIAMGLLMIGLGTGAAPSGGLFSGRGRDPSQIVPLQAISPAFRDSISEVLSSPSFHHKGQPETFPCHPQLYLNLLNEPALTLALWQDLSASPAQLQHVGPGRYYGTDGRGTSATWQFALRTPQLHVMLCDLDFRSPRGSAHLKGRVVLIVRSNYFKQNDGSPWVQHDVEAFVKIDSKGWRTVARTLRPLIERLLNDQLQEAGWFVSLMGTLVETYPDWASQVVASQVHLPATTRSAFLESVGEARRPGASQGRPRLSEPSGTTAQ